MADTAVLDLVGDFMQSNEYTIYTCKDGRTRIYDKVSHKVTSYPRYIMSNYLGRTLRPDEQIHHVDGNPTNNEIDNLLVLPRNLHDIMHRKDRVKYRDKEMICPWCGKEFLWTAYQQSEHNMNSKRRHSMQGPFCSKSCAGSYGRSEQLRRKTMTECE